MVASSLLFDSSSNNEAFHTSPLHHIDQNIMGYLIVSTCTLLKLAWLSSPKLQFLRNTGHLLVLLLCTWSIVCRLLCCLWDRLSQSYLVKLQSITSSDCLAVRVIPGLVITIDINLRLIQTIPYYSDTLRLRVLTSAMIMLMIVCIFHTMFSLKKVYSLTLLFNQNHHRLRINKILISTQYPLRLLK